MGLSRFWLTMADKEIKVHRRVIRMIFPMIKRAKKHRSVQSVLPVYDNALLNAVFRLSGLRCSRSHSPLTVDTLIALACILSCRSFHLLGSLSSILAQWKRTGPITQRSEDRNLALLPLLMSTKPEIV